MGFSEDKALHTRSSSTLLLITLTSFGCVYPDVILIQNFGLMYFFKAEQFFKNLQAFCKINFMGEMQKMHKGDQENYASTVNQVFLIKLVIVLSFINYQHPETQFPTFF